MFVFILSFSPIILPLLPLAAFIPELCEVPVGRPWFKRGRKEKEGGREERKEGKKKKNDRCARRLNLEGQRW